MILGKETCLEIANKIVKGALNAGATQVEVAIMNNRSYLTRFANSVIHQNVGERTINVMLRTVLGKKISSVMANDISEETIQNLIQTGLKLAKIAEENPDFVSLPEPEPIPRITGLYVRDTAECTAKRRAEMVKEIIDSAHSISKNVDSVSGALTTSTSEYCIVNSLGINAYTKLTAADVNVTVIAKDGDSEGFGYSEGISRNVKTLDPKALGIEAAERAVKSLHPVLIEPGEYEVILEPYAVQTALAYTAQGFSAEAYQNGMSFMNDVMGKKVMSENFNLWDDGTDKTGMAVPFDAEGVPKKKVVLIENGVPKGLVYDSFTAHKEGKKSTGHSGRFAPMPSHIFIKPGDATKDEMIRETRRGILVTYFHYVRTVHAKTITITGMTRNGTWYIENGEIKYPVKNLRFTDSLLKAYGTIDMIGKELKVLGGISNSVVVPPLKIGKFLFTGVTEF
ncbi:MAG: TldD/PmbA family protein [Candidatus Methanomethylicia archaeon]